MIRHVTRLVLALAVFPICAAAQTWTPTDASTITSACTTPPCKVVINPGNTTNTQAAIDAGGSIIVRGSSPYVSLYTTIGTPAFTLDAPTNQPSLILMRSGGAESVHLRREATSNDFSIWTGNTERMRVTSGGRLGFGSTNPPATFGLYGPGGLSQFTIGRNDAAGGVISSYIAATDAMSVGFDADISGGAWYARNATAAFLSKNSGKFFIYGSAGNTVNTAAINIRSLFDLDLNTAAAKFLGTVSAPSISLLQNADAGVGLSTTADTTVEANTTQTDYGMLAASYQNNQTGITNLGGPVALQAEGFNKGAGTVTSTYGERVRSGVQTAATGTVTSAYGTHVQVLSGAGTITNGYGVYIADTQATTAYGLYQESAGDRNYFAGKVAIGTLAASANALEVAGNANFSGTVTGANIRAQYQDLAEWVPATMDMPAGTVVVLNELKANEVRPSTTAYDTRVAGVVSAKPGLLLGEGGAGKAIIATTGRVRVKVDATQHPIHIGDLLVTSAKPGTAMFSEPLEISGRQFHQPGTVVGKALEPLNDGQGEILVLLSLQ